MASMGAPRNHGGPCAGQEHPVLRPDVPLWQVTRVQAAPPPVIRLTKAAGSLGEGRTDAGEHHCPDKGQTPLQTLLRDVIGLLLTPR